MANGPQHPLEDKNPWDLTPDQWRVLTSYRLEKLESRVDGLFKAMWTIAGGIIVGVIVFILTQRPGVTQSAAALIRSLM